MYDDLEQEIVAGARRRRVLARTLKWTLYLSPLVMMGMCSQRLFAPDLFADKYYLDEDQKARLRAHAEKLEAQADRWDASFQAALAKIDDVVPRPDLGRCHYALGVRLKHTKEGWQSPQHNAQFAWHFYSEGLRASRPYSLRARAGSIKRQLEKDDYWKKPAGPRRYVSSATRRLRQPYEVVLIVEEKRQPREIGTSFIPGLVKGVAYLFDHERGAFVCASHVEAESSSHVDFRYTQHGPIDFTSEHIAGQAAIDNDFSIEIERAIAMQLEHAAGPRPTP